MSSAFYSFINSLTNSITSRYDIKQQISTAGLWKIYDGVHKTTHNKVAIFVSFFYLFINIYIVLTYCQY
ncbi:hypothetical protein BC941DRAFT_427951 [Chlamydoabsidia padenii]|nr:hypothetical protein BC941DRAFT_427951 [Chlamydoabsidia padenii]